MQYIMYSDLYTCDVYAYKGGVVSSAHLKNDTNTYILPDAIQCPLHLPIKKQNKALENLSKQWMILF